MATSNQSTPGVQYFLDLEALPMVQVTPDSRLLGMVDLAYCCRLTRNKPDVGVLAAWAVCCCRSRRSYFTSHAVKSQPCHLTSSCWP